MSFTPQTPQEHAREKYDELLQELEAVKQTAEEGNASEEIQVCLRLAINERRRELRR